MQSTIHPIPSEKRAALDNALLQTFDTTAIQELSLLAGGLSASSVYKLVIRDRPYVLKLDHVPAVHDLQHSSCMETAAVAGIAPQVFYLDKTAGITITGFIKHVPLAAVYTTANQLLVQLAHTIRSIHQLPLFSKESRLADTVDRLIAGFKGSGMLKGPTFDICFDYYNIIREHYPWQDTDKVSSHNDLNPNNLVCDGEKIWVIDWDAASANDRYVDLAIAANFYVTGDEQENFFLENYFGMQPTAYQKARLFMMRQVCRMVYALLLFETASRTRPPHQVFDQDMSNAHLSQVKAQLRSGQISLASHEGQLLFGKALLNEAVSCMQQPGFELSIRALQTL